MDRCELCKCEKKDDVQYGEFLREKSISVHTFCLYLSSNLCQNGKDNEGYLGFLISDIRDEVRRISQLSCCYCGKRYANIGCCDRKCRRSFHFICGLENGAQNQFADTFQSYCYRHVRKFKYRPAADEVCCICYENIKEKGQKFSPVNMLRAPCCRNGWFHKLCLLNFAKTAGYFFKCPLCNDKETFCSKLKTMGIFIPNRDAAWELEPDAFVELLERPNTCSASQCCHNKGRKANDECNPLLICNTCGTVAIHEKCIQTSTGTTFCCNDCKAILRNNDSGNESLPSSQCNNAANANDDAGDGKDNVYEIDICNLSSTSETLQNEADTDMEDEKQGLEEQQHQPNIFGKYTNDQIDSDRYNNINDDGDDIDDIDDDDDCIQPVKRLRNRIIVSDEDASVDDDDDYEKAIATLRKRARIHNILCDDTTNLDNGNMSIVISEYNQKAKDSSEKEDDIFTGNFSFPNKIYKFKYDCDDGADDDDDDDPLDDMCAYLEKRHKAMLPSTQECNDVHQEKDIIKRETMYNLINDDEPSKNINNTNEISCLAKRTRKSRSVEAEFKLTPNQEDSIEFIDHTDNSNDNGDKEKININIQSTNDLNINTQINPVDNSCIAKRTRHKSSSAAAICTRRKTIDTTLTNACDINDNIATAIDISCVANRTRKRKSLHENLQSNERKRSVDSVSSSTSTASSSSAIPLFDIKQQTENCSHICLKLSDYCSKISVGKTIVVMPTASVDADNPSSICGSFKNSYNLLMGTVIHSERNSFTKPQCPMKQAAP